MLDGIRVNLTQHRNMNRSLVEDRPHSLMDHSRLPVAVYHA